MACHHHQHNHGARWEDETEILPAVAPASKFILLPQLLIFLSILGATTPRTPSHTPLGGNVYMVRRLEGCTTSRINAVQCWSLHNLLVTMRTRGTKLTIVTNCQKTNVPHTQSQAQAQINRHSDEKDYDTDSPPYSPTPSEMERPSFHPQTVFDLRQACAILVNETNPPDPDDEPDHRETLRRFEAERKAKHVAQARAAEVKPPKTEPRELKSAKAKNEVALKDQSKRHSSTRPTQEPLPKPAVYQPTQTTHQSATRHTTAVLNATTGNKRPSEPHPVTATVGEPLEPTHTKVLSAKAQGKQKEVAPPDDSMIYEIRQSIQTRPKTSAAATVDYVGEHSDSSRSTSRSTSHFPSYRPTSTGLTSLAITPGEEKQRSHVRRPSDESYQEELARREAEDWMREKLAQRQAEQQYTASGPARPASRSSRLSRMTGRSEVGDRPVSRAGSFAGSIADSISNYIRPRGNSLSADSMRSGRTSAMSDASRSSSMSRDSSTGRQGFFRRNSLRRKGSWASFRSARPDQEEKNTKKNGEPNLNRPLPALPGLDSYKESKPHIGQLMKGGGKKPVKKKHIGDPQPLVAPQTLYTATLPKPATPILDLQQQMAQHQPDNNEFNQQYGLNQHYHPADQSRRSTLPKNVSSQHHYHQQQQQQQEQGHYRHQQQLNQDRHQQVPTKRSSSIPNFPFGRKSSSDSRRSDQSQTLHKNPSNISNPLSPTQGAGNRLHQGPPVVRGPSYHREMEAGLYPRPMEVGNGPPGIFMANGDYHNLKLVDIVPPSSNSRATKSALGSELASPLQSPLTGSNNNNGHGHGHGNWDHHAHHQRKTGAGGASGGGGGGGLKGAMGRMFGSSSSAGHSSSGRAVAAN